MRLLSCPLEEWEIARALPDERLRPGVHSYRGFRIALKGPQRRLELPQGMVTLVIGFEGPVRVTDPVRLTCTPYTSLVAGLHTRPTLGEHDGRASGVQVILTPWAAFRLLAVDMYELAESVVDLEAVLGPRGRALADALAAAPGWDERFALLDRVLTRACASGPAVCPQVLRAWELLCVGHRRLPVGRVAAEVGWSERQLRRRFQEQIGLSPMAVTRVVRLRHALQLLTTGASTTATASACGFHDQPHFQHEFKAMTSLTPAEFLAHRARGDAGPARVDRIAGRVTSVLLPAEQGAVRRPFSTRRVVPRDDRVKPPRLETLPLPERVKVAKVPSDDEVIVVRTPEEFLGMPEEYQSMAKRQMLIHAEGELSGADDYIRVFYPLAPNAEERQVCCERAAEEINHFKVASAVLSDLGIDTTQMSTQSLEERRKLFLTADFHNSTTWAERGVVSWLIEDAVMELLKEMSASSYRPWADSFRTVIQDERVHIAHGARIVRGLVKDREGKKQVQAAVDRLWPHSLDVFGSPDSKKAEVAVGWGLRTRTNAEARHDWQVRGGAKVKKLGLTLPV
ncbi:Phenylacetic acid catabolic protein [Streptomyces nojiriensis]